MSVVETNGCSSEEEILAGGICGPPTDTAEEPDRVTVPARTVLEQSAPNPFNPVTTIHFDLAQDGPVTLRIYDIAGHLVRTLVNGTLSAGFDHRVPWNGLDDSGRRVPSGIYFYRLVAGKTTASRKMVVMK